MNKKVCLFLVPLLLTGCSLSNANNNEQKKDEGNYLIKEETSIDFLCMLNDKYKSYLQEMIDEFKEIEPKVTVNLSNPLGSGNYAMLEKTVIAGFYNEDYPDIVQCYPDNVVKYLAKGYAVNLDTYINDSTSGLPQDDKEDYISAFMEEGQQYSTEGTYSLPFCKSTELMYYNADALLGIELDGVNNNQPLDDEYFNNLTWEELFNNLCPKLKAYNDSLADDAKIMKDTTNSAIFTYDSDENLFITLANQYGYGYTSYENGKPSIDFDNEEMKALVKKLKVAKDNKYFQTKNSYGDYVSSLFTDRESLFTVSSTASLAYNFNEKDPFAVGVAKIPYAEGKDYSAINQGPSICILDHKDNNRSLASYLLWKHITDKTNSFSWSMKTGYMGIRNSCYTSDEYKASLVINDPNNFKEVAEVENRIKIAEVRSSMFNTPVFRGSGNARTNVGLLLKVCLLSEDLDSEIDKLFKDYSDDAKKYLEQ